MEIGPLIRIVAAPLVLAAVALAAWQSAENADFEAVAGSRVEYEAHPDTPMLSARRIPQTLQAPVSDDILAVTLTSTIESYAGQSCLTVVLGQRDLEPMSDPDGGLVPASNQKLLTTFAALDVLGPDFVFTTTVRTADPFVSGIVDGDLYLVGDGDPFLTTDDWMDQYDELNGRTRTRLEDLADAVVTAGVTEVTGAIVGDESLYDSERYGPWDSRLIVQKQSGPLSALTVNEGFVEWPAQFLDSFRPRSETDDPPRHAAAVFTELLEQRGVNVVGPAAAGVVPGGSAVVADISSPPLSDIITHVNSYSSNLGAELLLKRLGLARAGEGSTAAGAAAVREVLNERGVSLDDVVIDDGSGLAESNRLTCQALTDVLSVAEADSTLAQSLSITGERGSLAERFIDTPVEGQVYAKTGTLLGVRALSGYAVPADEDNALSFAYIINDPEIVGDAQLEPQEALLRALIRYPEGPTLEELSPLPAAVE